MICFLEVRICHEQDRIMRSPPLLTSHKSCCCVLICTYLFMCTVNVNWIAEKKSLSIEKSGWENGQWVYRRKRVSAEKGMYWKEHEECMCISHWLFLCSLFRFEDVLRREAYLYSKTQPAQYSNYSRPLPDYEEQYSPSRVTTQVGQITNAGCVRVSCIDIHALLTH